MLTTKGFFNTRHRKWTLTDVIQRCEKCSRDKKNMDDLDLEMFLRFKISHHLKIENDNFTRLFEQYKDISFNLVHINVIIDRGLETEMSVIDYFLRQKLVLGVGFRLSEFHQLAKYTTTSFAIPILKDGKMWQIIFDMIRKKKHTTPIDKCIWNEFKTPHPSLDCLLCKDYPYGCYPGNFIVNQSVLYMRSFIWMDKHKFHVQKSNNNNRIIMYKDSKIVAWPFLRDHMYNFGINCLWNMAVFSPGEVFTSFVDIVISRIRNSSNQNRAAIKLQQYIVAAAEEEDQEINLDDLIDLYKYCRKKKQYEIGDNRLPKLKSIYKTKKKNIRYVPDTEEESIISAISIASPVISRNLLNWFKFPKCKTSLGTIIHELSQMIRRGEIDIAITQTSILNKEYNSVYENNDVMNKNNLDVHRIGRFTRNAATNCFCNICGIACGLQKVLPKESKTKEPKLITNSEIGFIDLLNTPDTPRNCGLVVESVIDVIISTLSMTVNSDKIMSDILQSIFDDLQLVPDPHTLDVLCDKYVYICANQVLYKFMPGIPKQLLTEAREYLISCYGSKNYFRMAQYILKIQVPCIELIKESDSFWVCSSFPRTLFKIHNDGLLYTSREIQAFEHDPETIKNILKDKNVDDGFLSLWVGKNNREFIPNIFGPSIRATPKPNSTHLPRVSHSISTMKHAVGLPNNSNQIGSVHQRGLTAAYYCFKLDPTAGFILPGYYPAILVAGGWNNQEDGIVVKKSSIDRGMFLANCYETAAVKVNYGLIKSLDSKSKIVFIPTITKGDILRPGIQVGIFRNFFSSYYNNTNTSLDSLIELFSSELKIQYDEVHFTISILWIGKQPISEFEHKKPIKCELSMAYVESHPISCVNDNIRCENLECIDVEHMKHLKLYLTYSNQFTPTVGDKLQTPTSQKGVITELVGDADMPYILMDNGECFYPDMLVNPHFLKRQTFDNLYLTGLILDMSLSSSSLHMNNCFSYSLKDTVYYIGLGEKLSTGKVMNPMTGLPYLRPVHKREPGVKYYCPPNPEYVDQHGFTCIDRGGGGGDFSPHEIVRGSIFYANYYNVNNHKASAMMHSSKGDEIIRTDFSGAPVRGKKGGFSTGPQEHLAFAGMGMERFNAEISHMRSDFCGVKLYPVDAKKRKCEILGASSTFMRINDDINLRNKNVTFELTKHVDVRQKK